MGTVRQIHIASVLDGAMPMLAVVPGSAHDKSLSSKTTCTHQPSHVTGRTSHRDNLESANMVPALASSCAVSHGSFTCCAQLCHACRL